MYISHTTKIFSGSYVILCSVTCQIAGLVIVAVGLHCSIRKTRPRFNSGPLLYHRVSATRAINHSHKSFSFPIALCTRVKFELSRWSFSPVTFFLSSAVPRNTYKIYTCSHAPTCPCIAGLYRSMYVATLHNTRF